jgi:hypothetical protein
MTSNELKRKRQMMTWTMYVMDAVAKAKRTKSTVTLHVGKESSAMLLQDALLSLAFSGEDAAWNVQIEAHTLHTPTICISTGWLIKKDKDVHIIVADVNFEDNGTLGDVGNITTIPSSNVLKIRKIRL